MVSSLSPFGRFALAHALGVGGDLFITVSLADSLFLSADPGAAKSKVLQYLVFTMLPFAVVAPLVGPTIDRSRGGRRMMFILSVVARVFLCFVLARHFDDVLLYPLVLMSMVCGKAQSIAKSSIVPTVVDDESELVRANSRLALITVLTGVVAAPPAALLLKLVGAPWVLRVGGVVFLVATLAALWIPRPPAAPPAESQVERDELHASSILVAGTAMGVMRGVVGFLMFFVAFVLKREDEAAWVYGVVIAASAVGGGLGNVIAPLARRVTSEGMILGLSITLPGVVALLSARSYSGTTLIVVSAFVAMGASCGRLAFDSIVQRDAPDADRGRAFARFETRFQLVWVAGGVLAVAVPFSGSAGLFVLSMTALFAGLSYLGGFRSTRAHRPSRTPRTPTATAAPAIGHERPASAAAVTDPFPPERDDPFPDYPPS